MIPNALQPSHPAAPQQTIESPLKLIPIVNLAVQSRYVRCGRPPSLTTGAATRRKHFERYQRLVAVVVALAAAEAVIHSSSSSSDEDLHFGYSHFE